MKEAKIVETPFWEVANFTPKQEEAQNLADNYKYLLYGGAMGGGKSYWLRWQLLFFLMECYISLGKSNVTVGLFCEDYPALKDRHLSKVLFEFPTWLGKLNSTDHNFVLKKEFGSGILAFRNLDDASKYQSSEFAAIAVDEITKNEADVFSFLRTRMRWPGIVKTRFYAASNPGGQGHSWVKKLWLDRIFEENEQEADQFMYLQALAKDNPHIDPSYLKSLEGLPEDMRKAFLEGDWDIFKGQYFSEWRQSIHVCDSYVSDPRYKKFISIDYGYAAPSAVYWWFKDEDGVLTAYRELYETSLTYAQLAKEIIAMTPDDEVIDYIVADPAIWSKKGETSMSGAELFESEWKSLTGTTPRLIKGINDRLIGWNLMRSYLKPCVIQGRVTALLQVHRSCVNFIRTFPSLVYDKHVVEDCDSGGDDHAADSARYAIMSKPLSSATIKKRRKTLYSKPVRANSRSSY